ncbi:MAG TPA: transporter [Sphingobacteriaceae bacterium]|nr:transporter [Sphingobacteriaceae bacterium]
MNLKLRFDKIIIPILLICAFANTQAQTLTLQEVQQKARTHYPMSRGKELLDQTEAINIANLSKGYLPQFSLNGQATYQSAVTKVNIPIPGVTVPAMDKDQYKITADISQSLFDGGVIAQQQKISKLSSETQKQQLEVELFQVKERVNQLYLSILYLDEQLKQIDLVTNDLQTGISKTQAQVNNGVAFRSNLDVLNAELLKNKQRTIELQSSREGLLETLGLFTGEQYSSSSILTKPVSAALNQDINRPELTLYGDRQKLAEQQKSLLIAKNMPRLSLFGQGGYGRPGLNMLNSEFDWFYLAGLRVNWAFGGFYTLKNERKQLDLDKSTISLQQETFLLNTKTQLSQQAAEIKKQQQLLITDEEIITLRDRVITAAKAQLENGVITANDYLREVNAADQARQNRAAHQLLLLQAQINYQNLTGY